MAGAIFIELFFNTVVLLRIPNPNTVSYDLEGYGSSYRLLGADIGTNPTRIRMQSTVIISVAEPKPVEPKLF